jgi:hypothetical protein
LKISCSAHRKVCAATRLVVYGDSRHQQKPSKISPVNNAVTDILGSLDAYRRNVMKKISVDAFTFEVARALGTDLTTRIGAAACCQSRQDQLFAIILAMEKMGFVDSKDSGREALFIFSARVRTLSNEMPTHQWESLFQSHVVLKLKKSELSNCAQLSNDVVAVLDVGSVESCWRRMRSIIDLVLDGTLMVFQHEAKERINLLAGSSFS